MGTLPTSLSEWVTLLVQLFLVAAAVAGFLWRVVKQPIDAKIAAMGVDTEHTINGLGGRVKVIEEGCTHHSTLIDKHDRAIERIEGEAVRDKERLFRLEGAIERLVTAIERNRDAHIEEDSEIRERLVRIETKVDALQHVTPSPPERRAR